MNTVHYWRENQFVYGIIDKGVPEFDRAIIDHPPVVMDRLKDLGKFAIGGNLMMVASSDLFHRLRTYTVIAREDKDGKLLFAVHREGRKGVWAPIGKELGFESLVVGSDAAYLSYLDDDGDKVETEVLCLQDTTTMSANRALSERLSVKMNNGRPRKVRSPLPIGFLRSQTPEGHSAGNILGVLFIQTFAHSDDSFELIDPSFCDLEWLDRDQIKKLALAQAHFGYKGTRFGGFAWSVFFHIDEVIEMAKLQLQVNAKSKRK